MKTPSMMMNEVLKKRAKKNKKGFSLVELIVVLVIMAILIAALVPSLVGYIRQARQSNSKDEAASAVQAVQTITSSAYASPDKTYINQSGGSDVEFTSFSGNSFTTDDIEGVAKALAEVQGSISAITLTDGVVTQLTYTAQNGDVVAYDTSATPMYDVTSG